MSNESNKSNETVNPIDALIARRSEMEAAVATALKEIAALAKRGDIIALTVATQELNKLQTSIEAITREISETGFAVRLTTAIEAFIASVPEADLPQAEMAQFICVFRSGKFEGVRPHVQVSAHASGKAPSVKAALASAPRDPRLPPAGTVLKSVGGKGREGCLVEFTEGLGVSVSGVCADGVVFKDEPFSSLNAAATRVVGKAVNAYDWAQLGPRGTVWNGAQVRRKGDLIG